MKLLIALSFLSLPAFADCNPTDNSTCKLSCPGGGFSNVQSSGSSTYGYATGGVECNTFNVVTPNATLLGYEYRPIGLGTNRCIIWGIHGGGWTLGDARSGFGNDQSSGNPSTQPPTGVVQKSGCIAYMTAYTLATGTLATAWPVQITDTYCFIFTGVANGWDGNWNDIRLFGGSAGAHIAEMLKLTSPATYTQSCNAATSNAYTITSAALLSTPQHLAGDINGTTAANSMYQNTCDTTCQVGGVGIAITAINELLQCSNNATCEAADNAAIASPLKLITNANAANAAIPVLYLGGQSYTGTPCCDGQSGDPVAGGDNLVIWRVNTAQMLTAYAALSTPLFPAQWQGIENPNFATCWSKHESDFLWSNSSPCNGISNTNWGGVSLPTAIDFLVNPFGMVLRGSYFQPVL